MTLPRQTARGDSSAKAAHVEAALEADLVSELDAKFSPSRFVPFVLMHEFEGLLFSDCAAFSQGIGRPQLASQFQTVRDRFKSPEEINDSPATAPSKRIAALVPGYEKPLLGVLGILSIGLTKIRTECGHFDQWIRKLEALAKAHQ